MNCLGDGEIQIEKCPGNRIFFLGANSKGKWEDIRMAEMLFATCIYFHAICIICPNKHNTM